MINLGGEQSKPSFCACIVLFLCSSGKTETKIRYQTDFFYYRVHNYKNYNVFVKKSLNKERAHRIKWETGKVK